MMGIQPGKPHDEIRFVRIEILSHNRFVRSEILRVKISQFLIAGILHRLVVPLAAVTGPRTKDDASPRVCELRITGDDRSIVFTNVDDGKMPQRANP